jgi:hypothetical protein
MVTGAESVNHERLGNFVSHAIRRAAGLPGAPAATLLRVNAEVLRRHLNALAEWAGREPAGPCPPHLLGLSAFDLSDAAEALEAEAARRCA